MDFSKAGDTGQFIPPLMALAFMTEHKDKEGLIEFTKASAMGAAMTFSMKQLIEQRRPNQGGHSMPSGHTWSAVNGAEFIHRRYGWKSAVPTYIVSGFVGYSRIHSKAHYFQDVAAGAAIGLLTNYVFTKNLMITPHYSNNRIEASATYAW